MAIVKYSRAAMLLFLMLLTTASAWAEPTFLTRGDGEGTEANPYKITNPDDLRDLSVYVYGSGTYSNNTIESTEHPCNGVFFEQTADIDLEGTSFRPIGDHTIYCRSISGTYDGGSYTITGLHVEGNYEEAGLFGRLLKATVRNVRLVSPSVTTTFNQGDCCAGALVGGTKTNHNQAYRVTIENCLVMNPTVVITHPGTRRWAGAIIGSVGGTYDTVSYCYFYDSNAEHGYAAIGDDDPSGIIVNTSVTRHITLGAKITTTTPATNRDNGFVFGGENYYRDGLELVLETSLEDNSANGYAIAYVYFDGTTPKYSLSNIFTVGANLEGQTILVRNDIAPSDYVNQNQGTAEDPYLIQNKEQMALLAQRVNEGQGYKDKFFKLTAPLYYDYTKENIYTPIGNEGAPFRGTFDGNNQEIAFIVLTASASHQGLFGHTQGGAIKNVVIHDSKFSGTKWVGAVVGQAGYDTVIENCTVYDTEITATDGNAGAIVGDGAADKLTDNYYYHCSRKIGDNEASSNNIGIGMKGEDVRGAFELYHITLADGIVTTTPATDRANGCIIEGKTCFRNNLELTLEPLAAIEGYIGHYYIGEDALSGNTLSVGEGCDGKTVTKAYTTDKTPRDVTYMKADGTTDTHAAITLDGSETTLETGWYYVGSDISFDHAIAIGDHANVNIVLGNGKTMYARNFTAADYDYEGVLNIYGQSLDTDVAGTLSVNPTNNVEAITVPEYIQHSGNVTVSNVNAFCVYSYTNITVNGGKLDATDIYNVPVVAPLGDIVINGGQVSVEGLNKGQGFRTYNGNDIVLGWTNTTDYIYSLCYETWGDGGQIRIADGRALTDGTTLFTNDNVTADALKGKTLRPAAVVTFDNGFGVTLSTVAVILGNVVAQPEDPTLAGATFEGWYSTDNIGPGGTAYDFSTPVNSLLTLYAKWSGIDYTIGYDLAGGELPEGQSNPAAYNSNSADITLVNPVRKGYTFAGWTGTGLTAPTMTVTIAAGSMASRQYTATWTIKDYTIAYDLAGGELPEGQSNPTTYNVETDNITLVNPVRKGYVFAGWTGTELTQATEEVIIAKGSTENRSYTATWTACKDFSKCTATVPNQKRQFNRMSYQFEAANWSYYDVGEIVKDGETVLTLGTDYEFGSVKYADENRTPTYAEYSGDYDIIGDHLVVEIKGKGNYDGTITAGFIVIPVPGSDDVKVSFFDAYDNSVLLNAMESDKNAKVTLQGRTLWKDGAWNTLCLPFNVVDSDDKDAHTFTDTPLEDAIVKELDVTGTYEGKKTGIDGSTLYLYFKDATSIEAGKPYLVKWTSGDNIVNPVFEDVKVDKNASTEVAFTGGKFVGSYSPVEFAANDKSILYLGASNKLYWPSANFNLNACRAHFELANGYGASEFNLNFDDNEDGNEATGVKTTSYTNYTNYDDAWYDLQGRRIAKPTQKGVYVHNGRKVVVK